MGKNLWVRRSNCKLKPRNFQQGFVFLVFIELLLFMTDSLNSYRSNRVMTRCHRLEQDKALKKTHQTSIWTHHRWHEVTTTKAYDYLHSDHCSNTGSPRLRTYWLPLQWPVPLVLQGICPPPYHHHAMEWSHKSHHQAHLSWPPTIKVTLGNKHHTKYKNGEVMFDYTNFTRDV